MKYRSILAKYDDFLKRIIYISERVFFLSYLFFIKHPKCRLDIITSVSIVAYKINLVVLAISLTVYHFLFGNQANIDIETASHKLVIY